MASTTRSAFLALAVAATLLAPAVVRAARGPALVLPPRADALHETLALGATEWVRQRLGEAGLDSSPDFVAAEGLDASRNAALPDAAAMAALAGLHGATTRAWTLDLRVHGGEARVRLLLVDLQAGTLEASARAEAPLASLGEALAEATRALAAQEGLEAPALDLPTPGELDRYGRALAHLRAGRPAAAWLELGTRLTPTARALQERIGALGASETLPLGERARLAVARGQAERARLWLRAHLAETQDPALVLAAAESAEQISEWERALSLHERALVLDPASGAAAVGRLRALLRLGRGAELSALLATPLAPDADPEALAELAELPGLDAPTLAQLHLRIAELAAARFDDELAAAHLARASGADPTVEPAAQHAAALLYASVGESERARVAAERALELGRGDAPVLEVLGTARRRSGDTAGAKRAFEQAQALEPERPAVLVGLAEIASEQNEPGRAVELLREAVAIEPRAAESRVLLAGLMRSMGDVDGALAMLEGADPRQRDASLLRKAAVLRSERGETESAVTLLSEAALLEPDDATLLGELAAVEEQRGNVEAATRLRARAERQGGALDAELDATTAAAEEAAHDARRAAASVADLVATFPTRLAGRERPIEVVALLAPAHDAASEGWLRWIRPRRVDGAAVERLLVAALAERYVVVGPGEIPRELEAPDQQALRAGTGDPASAARLNAALASDAVVAARFADAGGGTLRIELRMAVGDLEPTVRRFRNEARLPGAAAELSRWNPSALALAALVLVLAALPFLRGWGGLVVGIQYASLGKGFFSIKLSRRSEPAGKGRQGGAGGREARFLRRMRMMGRFQRHMVDRETHFKLLPARRYYVQVHGLLQDPASEAVIGNYFEEQVVQVARGKTARLDFDFRPKEAALELTILDGETPAPRALVALRGQPASLRYSRGGKTMLPLALGRHRILVGVGDRVLEREISIEGFAPVALTVEIHDETALLFSGCAEAVEPYLQGQLEAAVEALERAGQAVATSRVRGELFAARGDVQQAARSFQAAGRFEDAAALASEGTDPRTAAELYEQAGNLARAAEAWRAAGDPARAAGLYEELYRYEDALDCWRAASNTEKCCDLSEKLARNLDAAELALELGDTDRAIRNLQMVELRDAGYSEACRMLARVFAERGEPELATQKLDEAVTAVGGADAAPLELLAEYGDALERAGRLADAITVWESVRARDFHWPEAGTRVDSLRQALESERTVAEARSTIVRGAAAAESRYELLGEIGRGGMGVVFKARDRRLGRVVALKRLPDNLRNHPTAVRLFLREARAAAALNHRNIVTLYDADQEGDVYFLTMEFLDGFPLHEILAKRGKLSPRDVARIGSQAAVGLEYAHSHGVVHRDIKTSNLFFTRDKIVKIMDFGLAKMAEEVRRAATVVGGTPYYMAPEQAAGQDVDHRADLYAFGVTLYELLVGEVPFREGDIARHHRETPVPDPREKSPAAPAELVDLIRGLMAKAPEDRIGSAGEVAARLQRAAKLLAE